MYKTTSRNMQRSMGRDVTSYPKSRGVGSFRKYRAQARKRWHPIIKRVLHKSFSLPQRLPFWLSAEIGAVGLKRWLQLNAPTRAKAKRRPKKVV
jgi:hypothetical protein